MSAGSLDQLVAELSRCRICRELPGPQQLQHEPRPIFQLSPTARLFICSQAPGARAHASGIPFSDPSGVRLRSWMAVTEAEFYDSARVAIVPIGFCFPGNDANGAIVRRGRNALGFGAPEFSRVSRNLLDLLSLSAPIRSAGI